MVYTLIVFLALLVSIILDAYSDGIIDDTRKRSHVGEALSTLALLVAVGTISNVNCIPVYEFFAFYLIARAGMFNPIYNKVRGLDWVYTGTTDGLFDRWFRKAPPSLRYFFHITFTIGAIVLMINRVINC